MEHASGSIRIVIINGSVRPGNYTSMASALVLHELTKHRQVTTEVIEPATLQLPPPGTDPNRSRQTPATEGGRPRESSWPHLSITAASAA